MTTAERAPLRMPRTAEVVAADLRRRIVTGALVDGDTLPREAEMMEQYGVSRPTLREAIRILQSQSLITVRQGSRSGPLVHTPDIKVAALHAAIRLQVEGAPLSDVFAARIALGVAAASAPRPAPRPRHHRPVGDLARHRARPTPRPGRLPARRHGVPCRRGRTRRKPHAHAAASHPRRDRPRPRAPTPRHAARMDRQHRRPRPRRPHHTHRSRDCRRRRRRRGALARPPHPLGRNDPASARARHRRRPPRTRRTGRA